jgi:hypothetical protein
VYFVSLVLFWYLDEELRAVDFSIMKNPTASVGLSNRKIQQANGFRPRGHWDQQRIIVIFIYLFIFSCNWVDTRWQ